MDIEARNQRIVKRISKLLKNYEISDDISYSIQEKGNVYQCVISYLANNKWSYFWVSTGIKIERGNLRLGKKIAEEIFDIFKKTVKDFNDKKNNVPVFDLQHLSKYNTTNYDPTVKTKADWDFYKYMEYWLNSIIKTQVEPDTFNGYERQVTGRLKDYFTKPENKKTVKEITADDLDEFYNHLRKDLCNATIDHYNDNISSAFNYLMKKLIVRYNPTDFIIPIVVEVKEVPTYNQKDIQILFEKLKGDIIELPTLLDGFYGLRRSEIIGLREQAFDFVNNTFVINHVCIQNDGKKNKEKFYFKDKTKSKKGYRTFPLFPEIKVAVIEKLKRIEQNKILLGNEYNYEYDGYLCVQDNGNIMQPNFFTKRFSKLIKRYNLKKITPHGLRHSIATLLHIHGIDIRDLQDWLGHQNISSTNRYARSDYQKQLLTGNVVQNIFNKKSKDITKNNNKKRFIVKKKKTYACA